MIIPVEYAQVNYRFGGAACPLGAEITFGIRHVASGLSAGEVAEAFRDFYAPSILTYQQQDCILTNTHVKFGPNDTGQFADVPSNLDGDATGDAIAPQVSALITKTTNTGGRRGRGRLFMPGLPESAVDQSGVVDPANRAALTGVWEDFREAIAAADLPMVVLHSSGSVAPTTVTALSCQGQVATQRRRNRR